MAGLILFLPFPFYFGGLVLVPQPIGIFGIKAEGAVPDV